MEARKLVNAVYSGSNNYPKQETYRITIQIRRSAVSIASNIGEGRGRTSSKDTSHFVNIARGSLCELETQMVLSVDQKYIINKELESLIEQIVVCKKPLNGFIN